MVYSYFQDKKLSMLGFGTMRLPTKDGVIDEKQTQEMVDAAVAGGINYFDTAYPYHEGFSEIVIGKALAKYPRESYYLATKYPGHQLALEYHPEEIFEEQLKKCGVDYFDFYLLHNIYEKSIEVYKDAKWGIIDYFIEQKRLGRIKHLGFSTHGGVANMEEFLELYGSQMEFCQIQLNYLDWTLQQGKEKVELLDKYKIPVWVMEPVRGGKLAKLSESDTKKLKSFRPDDSVASWSFRFLMELPSVKMILSGMSDMEQMQDNLKTFSEKVILTEQEKNLLLDIAEEMKGGVPCTACRYCCDGCPKGLDIPFLLNLYNELITAPSMNAAMKIEALEKEKQPSACINCGACTHVCPQNINIPRELSKLDEIYSKMPRWEDICRERAEAARKNRGK